MSFFMISMALSGLMSSPPVSKHTPLPTSVTFGCLASPQRRSISRGARDEARPTAWMSGKFSFSRSSPVTQLALAPCRFASARAASSSSAGPMSFAGVLMRSRASVDALDHARQIRASTPSGTTSRTLRSSGLAVAREAVGAEREGERGEPRVVRCVCETIEAGRQADRRGCPAGTDRECRRDFPGRTARRRARRRNPAAPGTARLWARSRSPPQRRGRAASSLPRFRSSSPPSRTRSEWRG